MFCKLEPIKESRLGLCHYCSSGRDTGPRFCKLREKCKQLISFKQKTVLLIVLLLLSLFPLLLFHDYSNCRFCMEAGLVQLILTEQQSSAEIIFRNHQISCRFPQFHLQLMRDLLINTFYVISIIL